MFNQRHAVLPIDDIQLNRDRTKKTKTRSFMTYTEAAHDIFSLQLHESCLYVNVFSCWALVMGIMLNKPGGSNCPESSSLSSL